jgi:hypothetical protein
MCLNLNAGQNHYKVESFLKCDKVELYGITMTNKNYIQKEVIRKLNLRNEEQDM